MNTDLPNYAKLGYYWARHRERYRRFAEKFKLHCMECGGGGGWTEPILDDGTGPYEECGWCCGTGLMTPKGRGQWLYYKKLEKREKVQKLSKKLEQTTADFSLMLI
jgi:hypothetical protein